MPLTLERAPEACTLRLAGDIDITVAAELKQLLLEALAEPLPVRVDLQQVSTLSITAIQLLRAAERHASALDHSFVIESPLPASVSFTLSLAGLELALNTLPVAAA